VAQAGSRSPRGSHPLARIFQNWSSWPENDIKATGRITASSGAGPGDHQQKSYNEAG
jgi:hypothetical protein